MQLQETKFNYKIIFAALVAVILGILIAFYYSYAQSRTEISYLEQERELLMTDLTKMRAEVDRLAALNEVNDIELQDSRQRVQQLMDSVGRLTYDINRLREYRKELRKLEARYDSLRLRNNYLQYNNNVLADKYEETQQLIDQLRGQNSTLAQTEALLREKSRELSLELRRKSYLKLDDAEGSGFRMRTSGVTRTNKASTIEKLRGCVTVVANPSITASEEKVLYLQFLSPNMQVIEDNANVVSVNGNIYSKRVELLFLGEEMKICDYISVPEGSLQPGIYTLNVFEDEKLLATTEFQLK